MRFFSNEAKENADNDRDPDRAAAEGLPTPVPQQRVGSPWSDAPGSTDEPDVHEARDDTETAERDEESLRRDDSEVRHDGDDLVRDSDTPRSDSEVDLPLDDASADRAGSHRADRDEGAETERADAEQRAGTTTTYGPDGTVTAVDERRDLGEAAPVVATAPVESPERAADESSPAEPAGEGEPAGEAEPVGDAVPAADAEPVGDAGGTAGTGPAEDTVSADGTAPADSTGPVGGPGWTVASGTADDTGAEEPAAEAAPAVPVGAADAATAAKPDPNASLVGDKLFTDGDSFNERLRDIALSFVDDPKDATRQAGALVDEAIDKVTNALKAQKDALAGEGDDTERLRVELRGYRDILKRISSL